MPQWQAPSTHNEVEPLAELAAQSRALPRPYLTAGGVVRWWSGTGAAAALPAGATPLFVVIRAADGRRVFSTTSENEREPLLIGSHLLFR